MTIWLTVMHGYSAVCAFVICAMLLFASRTTSPRLLLLMVSEHERQFALRLISLFLFAVGMDLSASPMSIEGVPHTAAIALACVTGTVVIMHLAQRAFRWN